MTINGRVIYVAEIKRGISTKRNEPWATQLIVLETLERFPQKVALTIFGEDRITQADLKVGEVVDVQLLFDAHEYNGNWYNEIRALEISQNGYSRFVPNPLNPA